ncbi:MAG: DNA polymerase III subunit delta' [Thermodesulfobacteriota bacterium]
MDLRPAPEYEALIEQKNAERILRAFIMREAIPNALLFSGIEGSGKKEAALTFAMACNCERPRHEKEKEGENPRLWEIPCRNCGPCKKIENMSHPDLLFVESSGIWIKIGQIRDLYQILGMKPYEARQRVVIINNAQMMNPEAGNALLKILEEPPERTIFILIVLEKTDLLPTLASRCQHIRFNPIAPSRILEILEKKFGISGEQEGIAAAISNGNLPKAFDFAENSREKVLWTEYRNQIIDACGVFRRPTDPKRSKSAALAFAAGLSENKKHLGDALEVLKSFIRDLVVFHFDPARIINKDLTKEIHYASEGKDLHILMGQIETVHRAQKDITANVNPKLAMEAMILALSKHEDPKQQAGPFSSGINLFQTASDDPLKPSGSWKADGS